LIRGGSKAGIFYFEHRTQLRVYILLILKERFGGLEKKFYFCKRNKKNYMTAERKNHIITAISKKAKALSPEGSEIILFGSQARGDAHNGSDWDVLILLDKDRILPSDYDEYSYPLRELGWDLGECVNTVLYTKNDWQKEAFSPFYENVTKEGIRL
jgi:predicted nucleotidyltransferase